MELILYLIIGLLLGSTITWFYAKSKLSTPKGIPQDEVETKYILRTLYDELKDEHRQKLQDLEQCQILRSKTEQDNVNLKEKLQSEIKQLDELHQRMKIEFKNLANDILDEKSEKFTKLNQEKVGEILNPLKDKITEFENKSNERFEKDLRDRVSLKEELRQLNELNKQLTDDAKKLAKALKGDSKTQGDWGEKILESILDKAGLVQNLHYEVQSSHRDDQGKIQRPDYIIKLPDDKYLIIDSKVSITAYIDYINAEDSIEKEKYLKSHIASIKQHIKSLSDKSYQNLNQINTPDFVLMFVPNEPALLAALNHDPNLYENALDKNIAIVSSSTLLATLRTISYIWKQENQKNNVKLIAEESGKLYDKCVAFVDDLIKVGDKINEANVSYKDAMNKLTDSPKPGTTIIGRLEKIKKLGANSSKSLHQGVINKLSDLDDIFDE